MSRATVLLVLAALSYGGCKAATSKQCIITDQTATCEGEQFEFPLNLTENITQLYIHSTQVKTINEDNFAQYNELEVIDLSNCDITGIDLDTFTALSNLNELNLAGNKELSDENMFIRSQSLKKLNLSKTGIAKISENFFEELPNLEELDLSYTPLTQTQISYLLKLSNLSTLILSNDYANERNNFCDETNLRTIVFKTEDGDNETCECSDLVGNYTTPAQQDITTVPNITVNQSESDDNETKVENSDINKLEENDEYTTESNENKGTTAIVEDSTEDKNITAVNPPEEPEKVKTSDEKPKDDEQEQNKNENNSSTAGETLDNQMPPEVLNTNDNIKIAPVLTSNETAKIDEPEPENVAQNTSEPVTKNVVEKTDEPATDKVDDQTLPDNVTEETTTDMNNVNNTQVLSDIANSQKNNKFYSADNSTEENPAGDEENKTSGVTSSAAQSSGTNVVLGIILTVMVIGAAGFGYKYWKNRRSGYRNANTEETHEDGKELQTIVTHHTDPEQN